MVNKYLIFRTDRIGDFLITAILIKSIKRNDPNSYVQIISSKKNYTYIKSFKMVDEVILLNNGLINKLKLIKKLKKSFYKTIIVHDSKKRSKMIFLFLNKDLLIIPNINQSLSYLDDIKKILKILNFIFDDSDLDILNERDKIIKDDIICVEFESNIDSYNEYENLKKIYNGVFGIETSKIDEKGSNCPTIDIKISLLITWI